MTRRTGEWWAFCVVSLAFLALVVWNANAREPEEPYTRGEIQRVITCGADARGSCAVTVRLEDATVATRYVSIAETMFFTGDRVQCDATQCRHAR